MLQLTEEPNNPHAATGGDGSTPNVRQAIIEGVIAAKQEALRLGHAMQVGFNATPSFGPNDEFWHSVATLATPAFIDALDYIGLDFFPDVFRPLPPGPGGSPIALEDAVAGVISQFRMVSLREGNIPPTVPIHITENGWPTSPMRSYEQQATVLETIVRTIYTYRQEFNVTHYEYFDLRDADSSDIGFQFGLLRDDYQPKPAFHTYQKLIAELG
jgi:hypothetical protein